MKVSIAGNAIRDYEYDHRILVLGEKVFP
jgi:hypothetical protein